MTYEYKATVVRWIDGDTCELIVDLGFHLTFKDHFRLMGVDTPERGRPGAAEAHKFSETMAPPGSEVLVLTEKGDKYGRWLANVFPKSVELYPQGSEVSVNRALLTEGHAKLYYGGTKDAS